MPGIAAVITAVGSIILGVLTHAAGRARAKRGEKDDEELPAEPKAPVIQGYPDNVAQFVQDLQEELRAVRKERDGLLRRLASVEPVHNCADDPVAKATGKHPHGDK